MPPLVGGSASQSLITFRHLARRGSALVSFEYSGHGSSAGVFTLDKAVTDTQHALNWVSDYAGAHNLPLHGLTTCFGATALAAQFAGTDCGHCLWSFSAVSGLFRLDHVLRFEEFVPIFSRRLGRELDVDTFFEGVVRHAFAWDGDAFRLALQEYLTGLFPGLDVGRDHFEELSYKRVDIPRTLLQLFHARYLDGLDVPRDVPCHFFFGRNDDVLSLTSSKGRETYTDHIMSLIPHAQIYECEIDHVGRGPDHDPVIEKLADLFEESERDGSSAHLTDQLQGLPR